MKLLKSTKIAIAFAVIVGGGFAAMNVITDRMIMHEVFSEISPGKVNIVGVDPGAGYSIIISNQAAQLVQRQGGFGGDSGKNGEGATSGSIKNRLPLKDMIKVLGGDTEALGPFIMSINDIRENESWPPIRVVWTAERIQKALDGNAAERSALEHDLNMHLDGSPLAELRIASLENGIIVESPVTVHVNVGGTVKELVGKVQMPYKPAMVKSVESQYAEKAIVDKTIIKGYYLNEAKKVMSGEGEKENIADTLKRRIAVSELKRLAERPEQILKYAKIVVNDSMITGASFRGYEIGGQKKNDLTLDLNDEGRRRLWQFSKTRVGNQLLVVADGIGIAAPRIEHELAMSELTVTQIDDQRLLRDAVEMVNDQIKARGKK